MGKQVGIYQFNGKLGEAVGSKARKGYQIVKRAPVATKNPSTRAQVMQRALFAACTAAAAAVPEAAIIGFRPYAKSDGMSIRNAFSKILQKSGATDVTWRDVDQEAVAETDQTLVEYSRGNQPNVVCGPLDADAPGTVEFTYDIGTEINPHTTNLIAILYCPDFKEWRVKKITELGASGSVKFSGLPSTWVGVKVYAYCYTQCFESADQKQAYYNSVAFSATGDIKVAESNAKYSKTLCVGQNTVG